MGTDGKGSAGLSTQELIPSRKPYRQKCHRNQKLSLNPGVTIAGSGTDMAKVSRAGSILALLLLAVFLTPSSAGVRLGGISIGAGYGYTSGPPYWGWGGWYPPPLYAGWWGYPYAYPVFDPWLAPVYFAPQPNLGEVKLQSSSRDAEVYLDNAYAGTVSKLKSFWLSPGVYELEVRAAGQAPHTKRIYVVTGKTLKVNME